MKMEDTLGEASIHCVIKEELNIENTHKEDVWEVVCSFLSKNVKKKLKNNCFILCDICSTVCGVCITLSISYSARVESLITASVVELIARQ